MGIGSMPHLVSGNIEQMQIKTAGGCLRGGPLHVHSQLKIPDSVAILTNA